MNVRFLVRMALLTLLGYIHFGASTDQTFDIQVKFSNVRNTNGRIQLQIYRSQEAFAGEKPWKVIQVPKDGWKDKGFSYKVTGIPAGTYGIAILDDENSNKEMDYSFMVPKEGFGFSNYYHTAWSKPKFDNFKFTLNEDVSVNIKVRYV
ncbi:DUF2141 domain-containing protein [Crocinitomicaceae bacterium CZZ-1]|uniref:DUF2141 domain-containing protein n=1 Tax=Taishania pollutisoli TaxID=2766479 RepID=A0A8J6PHI0_9FLAO|nr:DUF2141 domain-containing protein [Taishania pollutisoli]MBC9811594.1 DUF2141 domain-containing protein [Taishania pollutisoli]NGF75569.1 DUF2141 domain-containing protein [Fluviicola sp. SGL-29]